MSEVIESLAVGAATVAGESSSAGAQAPLATAVAAVSGDGVSSPCDHQPVGDQGEARCEIESQPMAFVNWNTWVCPTVRSTPW